MYSPIAPKNRRAQSFTQEEKEICQQRYEGYDLSNDPKYFSWLHIHHSDEAKHLCELIVNPTEEPRNQQMASAVEGVIRKSGLSKLLEPPKPAKCVPPAKKSGAKVLTSTENLKLIEKREKREKIKLKETKRREREARREKIREKEKKKQMVDAPVKFTSQEIQLFEQ